MQTFTHMLTGAAAAIAFAPDISSGFLFFVGSTAPDRFDAAISAGNKVIWGAVHRRISHNPWYAAMLAIFVAAICEAWLNHYDRTFQCVPWYFAWFTGGIFLHLIFDICTPSGIPLIPFSQKKFSLKLAVTGHASDYVAGLLFACACLCWMARQGRLSNMEKWIEKFLDHPRLSVLSEILFNGYTF